MITTSMFSLRHFLREAVRAVSVLTRLREQIHRLNLTCCPLQMGVKTKRTATIEFATTRRACACRLKRGRETWRGLTFDVGIPVLPVRQVHVDVGAKLRLAAIQRAKHFVFVKTRFLKTQVIHVIYKSLFLMDSDTRFRVALYFAVKYFFLGGEKKTVIQNLLRGSFDVCDFQLWTISPLYCH